MKKNELRNFIFKAKLSTYASGKKSIKNNEGKREYSFSKGKFKYVDIYYGREIDHGIEIVHLNDHPVWSMSYRGGITTTHFPTDEVFIFLKKALSRLPEDFPVRGSDLFCDSDFTYRNFITGNIFDFIGYEEIYFKKSIVYYKKYMGGLFFDNAVDGMKKIHNSIHRYNSSHNI